MPRSAVTLARLVARARPGARRTRRCCGAFVAAGPTAARPRSRNSSAGTGRWCWPPAAACSATRTTPRTRSRRRSSSSPARPAPSAGNLAGWLYAVAVRTARGVRVMRDRRRKHETGAASGRRRAGGALRRQPTTTSPRSSTRNSPSSPEHYREAVVLCELRGLSRKQAAAELGIPEGTLSSRLAGAKRKLAARLSARGLAAPGGARAAARAGGGVGRRWCGRPCRGPAGPPGRWPAPRRARS